MKKIAFIIVILLVTISVNAQTKAEMDAARTKTWWFFGDTTITHEGILADVKEFKKVGIGGVVYYDQVHGTGVSAPIPFSPRWWSDLKFAAQSAKKEGLTFEINVSNGYVAGGPWVTPELSMQMLRKNDVVVSKDNHLACLPMGNGSIRDIAVIAFPDHLLGTYTLVSNGIARDAMNPKEHKKFTASSITYTLKPSSKGKSRTSAMNEPGIPSEEFYGTGYYHLDPPCTLEYSNDSISWHKICDLRPVRRGMSTYTNEITVAFPSVTARYFRLDFPENGDFKPSDMRSAWLSERPMIDSWQKKAAFHSDYIENEERMMLSKGLTEAIQTDSIIDVTQYLKGDTLRWTPPTSGTWRVMRIGYGPTNQKVKHGRPGMGGLQCDNMSREAVQVQWDNYVRPICDTLSKIGCRPIGVDIDSHEAGPQNWTPEFNLKFKQLRGYDMMKYLPALFGYIVDNADKSEHFLSDYRRTCGDLISHEYFEAFDSLARHDNLMFTAQAIGNSLSIVGDNLQAKGMVQKPQGEFWAYQTNGNYDVKESSSAAHIYGKPIASAEAFTDAGYQKTPEDLKKIADLAYVFGINEFVICAIPNQPWTTPHPGYLTGQREYGINRSNSWWNTSRQFWDYQARTCALLRKGEPITDIALFLGSDVPVKILANRVPQIPDGFDFDAFTSDALKLMTSKKQQAVMPKGKSYQMIVLSNDCFLSKDDENMLRSLSDAGVPVFGGPFTPLSSLSEELSKARILPDCAFHRAPIAHDKVYDDRLYFCHRKTNDSDIYFIVNHSPWEYNDKVSFRASFPKTMTINPMNGKSERRKSYKAEGVTNMELNLSPYESTFVIFRK